MDRQESQLNARIPKDLHKQVVATAKRKGLTLAEYTERVFRAAVEGESQMVPGFLEALEKLLLKHSQKKT